MRSGNLLLALLCLTVASICVHAQESDLLPGDEEEALPSRYSLEFILFRYAQSVSAGTEVFVPDKPVPLADGEIDPWTADTAVDPAFGAPFSDAVADTDATNADDAVPTFGDTEGFAAADRIEADADVLELVTGTSSVDFTVLPESSLTMAAIFERLSRLDAYEPILWSGWTQVVREQANSPAIALRRLGNVPLMIDGTLTLYLGRFVHLVVDLEMDAEGGTAASSISVPRYGDGDRYDDYGYFGDYRSAEPAVVYRIVEDRIMRNRDLRYFDHPKFGLIAKLTLVEREDTPGQAPAEPAETWPGSIPPAIESPPQ